MSGYLLSDATISPSSIGPVHHLRIFLLLGGNCLDLRCHEGEVYSYDGDGVFALVEDPGFLATAHAEILSAVEGLLMAIAIASENVDIATIRRYLEKHAGRNCSAQALMGSLRNVLRGNWDYSKVSTRGRAYAAHKGSKLADIVSKVRCHLQLDLAKGKDASIWAHFARSRMEERPQSGGVRFDDCYLDRNWSESRFGRDVNCHARMPYKLHVTDDDCEPGMNLETQMQELDAFIDSAYYQNGPWLLRNLCTVKLAILGIPTEKIFYVVGPCGDSKGLVSCLERGVVGGENTAYLDPSALCSEIEFRKSAHFATGKKNIVFTESREGSVFVGDLRKRFVVAEKCDIRSNFGQTAQVEFIGRKTHHCNYGDIHVVEKFEQTSETIGDAYCKSVYRRILGFKAGRATLVQEERLVDRENGVFPQRPLRTMTAFLLHPATRSLVHQHYLLPFAATIQ